MKKYNKIILSIIMAIVMVCTVIVPISVSAASQKGVVTGITSYLNVRSSPGTGYSSIGKLYNNETVTVVGSATGDGIDWYKIEFDDGYGYVSAEFIKLIEDDTDFEKNRACLAIFERGMRTCFCFAKHVRTSTSAKKTRERHKVVSNKTV